MTPPMPGTPPMGRPLASLSQRFFGQLIDGAVAFGLAIGVVVLTPLDNIVAPYLVFISYVLFADGLPGGQSLGKKALGVEVIHLRDGRPCGWGHSFLRNFLLMVLGPIDWVFIFGDLHQRLGDRAADTIVVVSAPRGFAAASWQTPGAAGWTPGAPPPYAPPPDAPPPAAGTTGPTPPVQSWMPPARPVHEPKVSYSSRQHAERAAPPDAATAGGASAPAPESGADDNPLAPRDPKSPRKSED